jgi:hypothetical protein
MKWARFAWVGIAALIYALTLTWYFSVWIHADTFRVRLLSNALFLFASSILLLVLRRFKLRPILWLTNSFKRWFAFWLLLGLCVPLVLFFVDRLSPLAESLLFTLWPSDAMLLLAPGNSWDRFLTVMSLSVAVNAGLYTGLSGLVWCAERATAKNKPKP